jgi:hypothetical protein
MRLLQPADSTKRFVVRATGLDVSQAFAAAGGWCDHEAAAAETRTLGAPQMGLLDRILGRKKPEQRSQSPEHAVLVHFAYGSTNLSELFALEERLEAAIADAGVGEFDGNEVATDGSDGTLYMYGPDADALFAVVRPALDATDFMRGARVRLRYGPPEDGVREVEVVLGT